MESIRQRRCTIIVLNTHDYLGDLDLREDVGKVIADGLGKKEVTVAVSVLSPQAMTALVLSPSGSCA